MIADCAIEPEVFATWRHFQSLYEDFGVPRGRLISKFPSKWIKRVAEHSRELVQQGINTEMQAAKIEERLRSDRFKRKLNSQGGRVYDPVQSWIDNAEDATPPFDLIITSGSMNSGNRVGADLLLKDEEPFKRAHQSLITRNKEQLIAAASTVVLGSEHIVIIDPNFRADEPRFGDTVKHLLSVIQSTGRTPKRLEIHTNRIRRQGDIFNRNPHLSQWEGHLIPYLPSGWKLSVCYWDNLPDGGKSHARFILTDLGGLHYDHGIDEGDGQTLVTLLDDHVWETLYSLYDSRALPANFDVAQHVMDFEG